MRSPCRGVLPALDRVAGPAHQAIQVLQQLVPSHHTRSRIRLNEIGALALRVSAHLLAHLV